MIYRIVVLFSLIVFAGSTWSASGQRHDSFEGFVSGIRANAVKGDVFYQREDGKFDLEAGLKLEEGDFIKTGSNSYAELLLQPGNYLRVGAETEIRIISDPIDKMRFKLNHGSISIEVVSKDGESSFFYESLSQVYELTRIITPNAEVFITRPGIFRINTFNAGRTDLIVRDGQAVINGRLVKEKRIGAASSNAVVISEMNSKLEDGFDGWGRERAEQLVDANHLLKNESPWAKDRKEGEETIVDLPQEDAKTRNARYVVSARPGAVVFVEAGVEFSRPAKEWEPVTEKTKLEAGDKLRTSAHTFAELTMLPDISLRIDSKSEILFEELSNESISLKLLQGAAILDVARFDGKDGPPIRLGGLSTSVTIADDGNYRIDVKQKRDEITVRDGKVFVKGRSIGSCKKLTAERVFGCDKKESDNFDVWSHHRGEGQRYNGGDVISAVSHLDRLRRVRFRNTGFWFQNPGRTDYTFVPFSSTRFRSPYGGSYSTVLSPRRVPITRPDYGPRGPFGRGPNGPAIARPQP